jgi:alpha-mannosidase
VYTALYRQKLAKIKAIKPVLPATGGWLTLDDGPLVVTARKRSADGAAITVRAFSPTSEAAEQRVQFCAAIESAHLATLLDEPQEELPHRGTSVTLRLRPKQIVTLRVQLRAMTAPAIEQEPKPRRPGH